MQIGAAAGRPAEAGRDILQAGGSSIDAVEAAIRVLEDDPDLQRRFALISIQTARSRCARP
jgi:isoaspartyl peptidase/L-asparaginase-like protein (Ntn-hydrolase superfamily)